MLKPTTALLLASVWWLFTACASEPTCDYSKEPYMTAQSVPSLKAPDGLSTPDRSSTLAIPPLSEGAKPVPTGEGRCLDRPPSYFATAPDKKEPDINDKKAATKKDQ
jgi:uncharacterized lipoprotein